jgi:hypothetical protein
MLIREFISTVRNSLDALTLDNYISGEYIYKVGISYATLFIKRESDSRKIFRNTSMFTVLSENNSDCISFKPYTESCDLSMVCNSIMRSVNKIPTPYLSNYGSLILLYNIFEDKNYIETNPIFYKSIKKQKFKSKTTGYFYIKDGYLYILDSNVETLKGMVLTSEVKSSCKILDKPFPVLDYLESSILDATVKHLLTAKNIQRDENSNLNETN